MGNVDICHQQIVLTNDCHTNIGTCGTIDGDKLSDSVEVSNNYSGFFPAEFQILGRSSYGTELKDVTAFANMGVIVNYCVRADYCIFPDFNIGSNYRIRTNLHSFFQLSVRSNNCCWVNLHYLTFTEDLFIFSWSDSTFLTSASIVFFISGSLSL